MATIPVAIAGAPYDVRIEAGLLAKTGTHCRPFLRKDTVAIVTDEHVAARWRETVAASLRPRGSKAAGWCCQRASLPRAGNSWPA
jgi:3-dehydroquinate synthase